MANIYLVTSQEVAENTPMGGNVDPDKYRFIILDVQVMVLEPVLGTALYDKILSDFDGGTLAGVYLTMFNDYIKQVMWHSVFADYTKIGAYWVNNGGIYKHLSENSESVNKEEVDYLVKTQQSKADTYIDRLDRYLCDQSSNIPEYKDAQDNDYDIIPKRGINTIGGLYFGRDEKTLYE